MARRFFVKDDRQEVGWDALRLAVVKRAICDYINYVMDKNSNVETEKLGIAAKEWFLSKHFIGWTEVEGEKIVEAIDKLYGKCD